MQHITVPKEFFIKERKTLYSSFGFAFWRELFQNSIDAGASKIDIFLSREKGIHGGDVHRVIFADNGSGMTQKTLEDVFFRLGASTKGGPHDIGGFGRARLLLCFSMDSYSIKTLDCRVTGEGATYNLQTNVSPFYKGAEFTIDIPYDDIDHDTLVFNLKNIVALSRIKANITFNKENLRSFMNQGKMVRHLESRDAGVFADVYVHKSCHFKNLLIVQSGGVVMFTRRITSPVRVIVSLRPENMRDVLSASRDNMRGHADSVLNAFCDELAIDQRGATRSRFNNKSSRIGFGGMMLARRPTSRSEKVFHTADRDGHVYSDHTQSSSGQAFVTGGDAKLSIPVLVDDDYSAHQETSNHISAEKEIENLYNSIPDIYIIDECEDAKIRSVMNRFDPLSWDIYSILKYGKGKGRRSYLLLQAWNVACRKAIDAWLDITGEEQVAWTSGWYFGTPGDDNALAIHRKFEDGHLLALNPVDNNGKIAYNTSSREDLVKIIAYARHEVAHMSHRYHDERFAQMLTKLDSTMNDTDILSAIRERLKNS